MFRLYGTYRLEIGFKSMAAVIERGDLGRRQYLIFPASARITGCKWVAAGSHWMAWLWIAQFCFSIEYWRLHRYAQTA